MAKPRPISEGQRSRCQMMVGEISRVGSSLSDSELGRLRRYEDVVFSSYKDMLTKVWRNALASMYMTHCPNGANVKHARPWAKEHAETVKANKEGKK